MPFRVQKLNFFFLHSVRFHSLTFSSFSLSCLHSRYFKTVIFQMLLYSLHYTFSQKSVTYSTSIGISTSNGWIFFFLYSKEFNACYLSLLFFASRALLASHVYVPFEFLSFSLRVSFHRQKGDESQTV